MKFTTTRLVTDGDKRVTLNFSWHGGPYIDVAEPGRSASEVINVAGSGNAATIESTQDAFERAVDKWIAGYGEVGASALVHDVIHNWRV